MEQHHQRLQQPERPQVHHPSIHHRPRPHPPTLKDHPRAPQIPPAPPKAPAAPPRYHPPIVIATNGDTFHRKLSAAHPGAKNNTSPIRANNTASARVSSREVAESAFRFVFTGNPSH